MNIDEAYPSFTCPRCGMTSYNPNDIRERYCGNCHAWTGELEPGDDVTVTFQGKVMTPAEAKNEPRGAWLVDWNNVVIKLVGTVRHIEHVQGPSLSQVAQGNRPS